MAYLLNHLLTASAQKDPSSPALRYQDEAFDYAALEVRSNRTARALREVGLRAGDRVGLHMKKTADAIVALFGIQKAGGCVVPVGAGMPGPRLRHIVDQCGMRFLIVSAAAHRAIGPVALVGSSLDCIAVIDPPLDDDLPSLGPRQVALPVVEAAQSPEPLSIPTIDRDLAYILFTSGSTGQPKGVMLSHRAVLTFVDWASDRFAIRSDDRLSNHASLSFDLSTFDIFAAMGAGASVTVVPEGLSAFPAKLAGLIEEQAITVWYSVPSVLTMLSSRGGLANRKLDPLRLILFAGEVFPTKHLRKLMLEVPNARFFNLYGPTETNVCTYYEVEEPPEADGQPIPIGRACANTKTVVFDESGQPVSEPGGEGLLYVGGSTLMDGYFGLPAESATTLRSNPLTEGREEFLYCTGDWVRIGDDGEYLFLGRRDHMVKVGGYRVELGEIEAALNSCPGVAEAAAIAVPDDLIGNRIRAVVVATGPDQDVQHVRRHCANLLPTYMVPHEVEFRLALPRTATDKIDRPALLGDTLQRDTPGG